MTGSRSVLATSLSLLLLPGCVEQEPDRPTEEDKRIIRNNILKQAPEMKFKVNADLEGKVTYLGLDVDQDTIQPGRQFTLTHYWKVHKRVDGWRIFVHLNGPDRGGFINADHKPIGGRYPAAKWQPGEIIRDEHKVTLPSNYREPKVLVMTGLWRGKLRMRVKGPQDKENRILAATLPLAGAKPLPPLRNLVAVRADKPITLDGVLDEPVWTRAPSSGAFTNTMSGAKLDWKTDVKVAWDDKQLYFGFSCEDDDVWSDFKKRDEKLWTQEAVEIFIDADGDGKDYVELQVSPAGVIFDSYLAQYRKNQNDWNSKMKVAVKVDGTANKRGDKDRGWVVEAAIPWADVKGRGTGALKLPPEAGAAFKVNFFRMDLPRGKPQRAAAWSPPMVGDFHKLDRFGELRFGDEAGKVPAVRGAAALPTRVAPSKRVAKKMDSKGLTPASVRDRLAPTKARAARAKPAPAAGTKSARLVAPKRLPVLKGKALKSAAAGQ